MDSYCGPAVVSSDWFGLLVRQNKTLNIGPKHDATNDNSCDDSDEHSARSNVLRTPNQRMKPRRSRVCQKLKAVFKASAVQTMQIARMIQHQSAPEIRKKNAAKRTARVAKA